MPELLLAVWCLSEVRNLSRIKEEVGGNLLLKVVYWFLQSRSGNSNTPFKLPKAAAEVGLGWPGKYVFRFSGQCPEHEIHKAPPDPLTWCQMLAMMWSEFLAVVFGQRLWIEKLSTNESALVRNGVLKALDTYWPDDKTRQLLTRFAMQDKDAFWGRKAALSLLSARWSNDDETRQLLKERTAKDTHKDVRMFALEQLARLWPDEETRQLLKERTAKDIHEDVRTSALEQLARLWPDEETHQILRKLVPVEGMAASWYGTRHSPFGDIIFTRDLDGIRPYCNPRQPIPADHIQKAAKEAGIPPDKIDEAVRSLSEHIGWDITKGSLAGKL